MKMIKKATNYIGHLLICISALGIYSGYKYWKLWKLVMEDHTTTLVIIDHWRREAEEAKENGNDNYAKTLESLAQKYENHYNDWLKDQSTDFNVCDIIN